MIKMKNKGFLTLFIVNILLVIADTISTLLCGRELIKYLEANPIYKYGGIALIIFVNILVYWYFWYVYHKKHIVFDGFNYNQVSKIDDRYFCILAMCMIASIRCLAIYSNLQVALVEPNELIAHNNLTFDQAREIQINEASKVTEAEKIGYVKTLFYPMIMPYIVVILAWFLFRMDHKVEVK